MFEAPSESWRCDNEPGVNKTRQLNGIQPSHLLHLCVIRRYMFPVKKANERVPPLTLLRGGRMTLLSVQLLERCADLVLFLSMVHSASIWANCWTRINEIICGEVPGQSDGQPEPGCYPKAWLAIFPIINGAWTPISWWGFIYFIFFWRCFVFWVGHLLKCSFS